MKAKDQAKLRSLRAIKAEMLLLQTKEGGSTPSAEDELATLVKMAKQRKDSIDIYVKQNREDLAVVEREELAVIETFLPEQMNEEDVRKEVMNIIQQTGASSMKDMGKVMGMANSKLKGVADGKLIAQIVKAALNS